MAKPFNTLGINEIARLNSEAVRRFGGLSNGRDGFLHRDSLEYVLESTLFPVFGHYPYPGLFDRIAAIAQAIITRHVFLDGNKRTGMAVIQALAHMNGYEFRPDKNDEDYMVKIAAEKLSVPEISEWLERRLKKEKSDKGASHS